MEKTAPSSHMDLWPSWSSHRLQVRTTTFSSQPDVVKLDTRTKTQSTLLGREGGRVDVVYAILGLKAGKLRIGVSDQDNKPSHGQNFIFPTLLWMNQNSYSKGLTKWWGQRNGPSWGQGSGPIQGYCPPWDPEVCRHHTLGRALCSHPGHTVMGIPHPKGTS